jgi:hypothetical protein
MSRYLTVYTGTSPYILVSVSPTVHEVAFNPTAFTVECAFVASGLISAATWHAAAWETIDGGYWAKVLVPTTLTADDYSIYVRLTDLPEMDVQKSSTRIIVRDD